MAKIDKVGRDPNALYCDDPSLTKQAFAEECDVNEILRRATNGQDISGSLNQRIAQYGDVSNVPNFHEAMNIVTRANAMFMELPWQVRERFGNDPGQMVDFLQNEDNYDEAVKIGLMDPEKVKERREARAKEANASAAAEPAATGSEAKGTGDKPAAQ